MLYYLCMADAVGFELTNGLTRCRFSRPVPSTTRPRIHRECNCILTGVVCASVICTPDGFGIRMHYVYNICVGFDVRGRGRIG